MFDSSTLPILGSMKNIPLQNGFKEFALAILKSGKITRIKHDLSPLINQMVENEDFIFSILPELLDGKSFAKLSFLLTIQQWLGPIIEMVILADRVQALREKGHVASLVRIFDRHLSPRSNLLMAYKRFDFHMERSISS